MNIFKKLKEASLNETSFVSKRKYTQNHPAVHMRTTAPIRNRVLEFLNSKGGKATGKEIIGIFNSLSEEKSDRPIKNWIRKNPTLVSRKVDEKTGEVVYSLTKRGRKVHEMTKRLMEFREIKDYLNSDRDIEKEYISLSEEYIYSIYNPIIVEGRAKKQLKVTPKIEINTTKAEDECDGNDYVGDIITTWKDLLFAFGEPAIKEKKWCEWYLYDKATKVSYMIKNKENLRYKKNPNPQPYEVYCNVNKKSHVDAIKILQGILDLEYEWIKL